MRCASFRSSEPLADVVLDQQPRAHIDRNPALWQHVENILAAPIVPTPVAKTSYTSGWKPAAADSSAASSQQLPYFVARTKNHMVPVYLDTSHRGQRRITELRRIAGDVWQLERELHSEIERRLGGKPIVTRVNEMTGQIHFKGDFVTIVREYLMARGL